jgi:Domain of unknown function (DUF1918)
VLGHHGGGDVDMAAMKGERIVVESEHVGAPARLGEIIEVIEGKLGVRYLVRWDDGHQSIFAPASGSARVEPREGGHLA